MTTNSERSLRQMLDHLRLKIPGVAAEIDRLDGIAKLPMGEYDPSEWDVRTQSPRIEDRTADDALNDAFEVYRNQKSPGLSFSGYPVFAAGWQAALASATASAAVELVPGVMRCAKCKFQLVRTNLYVNSGTTGPGDSKTEPYPNGCGPLWPVTMKEWAAEGWKRAEEMFMEIKALRDTNSSEKLS